MKRLFKNVFTVAQLYTIMYFCYGIIHIVSAFFLSCNYTNDYNSITDKTLYVCHINAETLKYISHENHLQGKNYSHVQGFNQTGIYESVLFNDVGQQFSNLIQLNIQQANIKSIEKSYFNDLSNLTSLSLTNDKLHAIKTGAFETLTHLTILDLSNNVIEELPPGIFENLRELRYLTLNKNGSLLLK